MRQITTTAGSYQMREATPQDNQGLLQLLRETPMHGQVEVAFMRQPDYFVSSRVQGRQTQVFVGLIDQRIVCVGTRALRQCWINGQPTAAGYLADLRLAPQQRGGSLLARSYRFLAQQHADNRAEIYSTVIVAGNTAALTTIAANRKGMPRYTPLGKVHTPMLHVNRAPAPCLRAGETIGRGDVASLPEIVTALNAGRMQFAEVYCEEDFTSGRFADFPLSDIFILRRDGEVAGVLGLWSQQRFRQTVICGYNGWLKYLRPVVNMFRRPALPPAGAALNFAYAAFRAAVDKAALKTLLQQVLFEAQRRGHQYITLGLHENDPHLHAVTCLRHTPFAGELFAVTFNKEPDLDHRTPFVEAALL